MKKLLIFLPIVLLLNGLLKAQSADPKDSTTNHTKDMAAKMKARQDSMEKVFISKATYPVIKSSKWSGVIPVTDIDEKPDVSQQYKLLMEVTKGIKDSVEAKDMNAALAEVGRLINIHVAAGIPRKNLDVVVVAHGGILKSFYNNDNYKKTYKTDNPNTPLFNELLTAGVKFIACGQAMAFLEITRDQLVPWMKVALSAQSVLTNYELKGYVHKEIDTDK